MHARTRASVRACACDAGMLTLSATQKHQRALATLFSARDAGAAAGAPLLHALLRALASLPAFTSHLGLSYAQTGEEDAAGESLSWPPYIRAEVKRGAPGTLPRSPPAVSTL